MFRDASRTIVLRARRFKYGGNTVSKKDKKMFLFG